MRSKNEAGLVNVDTRRGREGFERVVRDIIKIKGYIDYSNLQCHA